MFQVGDEVEFELAPYTCIQPRWNYHFDYGATGKWWSGVIEDVDIYNQIVTVRYWNHYEMHPWKFYEQHLRASVVGNTCECGAIKVWGRGPHSEWCPLADRRV